MQGVGATNNSIGHSALSRPDARPAAAPGSVDQKTFGEGLSIETTHAHKETDADQAAPKFGEVWKKMQAEYGAKAEKPREVHKQLNKDDFMRLMIHQMRNQDPTSPFKADQMAQQMAQYASVEQLSNMNAQLGKLTTANQPLEHMAMAGWIGKSVTVSKERFVFTQGQNQNLGFNLPKDAASVKVSIIGPAGEAVATKDLGALKKGNNTYVWDGAQANTMPAKAGTYYFKVAASDENGAAITLPTSGQSRVIGVSFDGAEPMLLVGDPKNPDKVPMSSVSRVADEESVMIPGARSLASASAPVDAPPPMMAPVPRSDDPHGSAVAMSHNRAAERNGETPPAAPGERAFFSFEKGVGSKNMDPSELTADQRAALMRGAAAQAYGIDNSKGFPNGLSEGNSNEGGQL